MCVIPDSEGPLRGKEGKCKKCNLSDSPPNIEENCVKI